MIELVIVVMIIGVISAIAIPRLSSASENSRIAAVKASMKVLDTAVEMYAAEHDGLLPCQDASRATDAWFGKRLRTKTSADGNSSPAVYGPYLRDLPANPYTGLKTVRIDGPAAGTGAAGWRFDTATRRIQADDPVGATIDYQAVIAASGGVAIGDSGIQPADLGAIVDGGLD